MKVINQASLFCGCGAETGCRYCARRSRLNRERFAGNREAVLARDDWSCQLCGERDSRLLVVHHRSPGRSSRKDLLTLCRRCHVRIHFTAKPGYGFVSLPLRRVLWRELHRDAPEQRLLPIGETPVSQQQVFFDR